MNPYNNKIFYSWPHPTFLKVTKFSVKISQFRYLVMREKNVFVYRFFLSLNISEFSLFFM